MEKDKGGAEAPAAPGKKSRLLVLACVVALLAGGGAYLAVTSGLLDGLIPGGSGRGDSHAAAEPGPRTAAAGHESADPGHEGGAGAAGQAAFVMLDPLVISLGPQSRSKHLKVTLAIDAAPGREPEIQSVMPRVVDILQGFLRAVDEREFEIPLAMDRLRAQMLRRVQLVTPAGAVRDLLIQEFVLN